MNWWWKIGVEKRVGICLLLLGIGLSWLVQDASVLLEFERSGVREIGRITHYEVGRGAKHIYYVPVITISRAGQPLEFKGRDHWSIRWYYIGEDVSVISLPGISPEVGGFWLRWLGGIICSPFLILGGLGVLLELIRFLRMKGVDT